MRCRLECLSESDVAGVFLSHPIVLSWELLGVAAFIATLAALQFAVSSVTDATYRGAFTDDLSREIHEVLATRALYLAEIAAEVGDDAGTPGTPTETPRSNRLRRWLIRPASARITANH